MGITGLIPFLEKASSKVHLKDLRGATIAVDTYCWLHKGVFSCAEKLVRGEHTDQYLLYCLKYVQLLLSYDIKPILVFDGRHLPAKALTEKRRREARQQSKKRAAELLRLGHIEEARSHMRRCVDVTHEMALRLIRECRLRNVDCIVAAYEADAQMAWLNKVNLAQYIITEDSDLTLFGAQKIIFKLDLTGAGLLVEADKLYLAMGCRQEKYTFEKFRRMCILSGCDYLDSLPGIGLAKACKFFLKTEEDDMWRALKKIPQYLNMRSLEVDDEYIENFLKAEATFMHMYIYNPLKRQMERLHELDEFKTPEKYCSNAGTPLDDKQQAFNLALGNLNPFTLQQLDNWHPDNSETMMLAQTNQKFKRAKHKSIWQKNVQAQDFAATRGDSDMTKTEVGCALYFKKVDFISKTLDEDISANMREECAKPEEAEVFSMYKNENTPHANSNSAKRKRNHSISNSSSDDDLQSSSQSSLTTATATSATKIRHNPFAKMTMNSLAEASSPICENSSLLRVLSPKKYKQEADVQIGSINKSSTKNGVRRSIFTNADGVQKTQTVHVEVKSRFFAANLKQVTKSPTLTPPVAPTKDLTEEIEKIDQLSKQQQAQQALLYNSPSPKQECRHKGDDNSICDNIDGSEQVEEDDTATIPEEDNEKPTSDAVSDCNRIEDCDEIIISDDEESDDSDKTMKKPSLKLVAFKSQTLPRLGLSKTKRATKTKTSSKAVSATGSAAGTNQTRLSMFGFQKRPILK